MTPGCPGRTRLDTCLTSPSRRFVRAVFRPTQDDVLTAHFEHLLLMYFPTGVWGNACRFRVEERFVGRRVLCAIGRVPIV